MDINFLEISSGDCVKIKDSDEQLYIITNVDLDTGICKVRKNNHEDKSIMEVTMNQIIFLVIFIRLTVS